MSKTVAWDYVVKVTLPSDLKGVKPGLLPASQLVSVPGGGKLHRLAAQAWTAMCAKAKADGVELKPTSAGDTYRSYDAQLAAFKQRYTETPNGNSTRTFEGKKWYKKEEKLASLAAPGTSQHNLGIAVDVHSAGEPKRLNWLIDNVKDFGFSWEVVPEEPWHIRYVCGDAVPPAVQAWVDANPSSAPAPAAAAAPATPAPAAPAASPKPAKKSGPPAYPGATLQEGSTGEAVKLVQEKLGIPVTGTYDASTVVAIKKFKGANGLNVDAITGPKVWAKLFA
jgi:peptidoglycan hydrolase-like protein with peptidoglycan-binding domain